ncbi:MAG: fumarate/nitrate reduction transcriptional regulator Fnr [Gammaproteobacteria bacterium]|nr:fumarate/nitrate reduction transcriptional regulator Fnr [Gammaproteobacteria bacterium]
MTADTNTPVVNLDSIKQACGTCSLGALCLPMGLDEKDVDELGRIVKRNRPLHRGDHLFRMGDPFHSIFVVKSGSVKSYSSGHDGDEQVVGFHLPGEMLGLDAIDRGMHSCSAISMETTAVCELPFDRLEELSRRLPSLQHQIFRLLSKEINREEEMLLVLGKKSAEERLAAFLFSLSLRYKRRGYSDREFNLSMSRQEIGNYLGLAVETVSRLFTRFHEEGLLEAQRKHVHILDMERLESMVSACSSMMHDHARMC